MALTEAFKRALGVFGASHVFTDGDKRVFEKHCYLDQEGHGTVMSAVLMGKLLGKEPETVEACRRRLMRAGLLQRSEGAGRSTRWWVRFPESWIPKMPARPTVEQYEAASMVVDKLIASALAGDREEVPRESRVRPRDLSDRKPGQATGFSHISSLASVHGEGEGGGAPPQILPSERQPLPAVPEISGGGGFPSERDGGGGTAGGPDSPEWKAAKASAKPAWADRAGEPA